MTFIEQANKQYTNICLVYYILAHPVAVLISLTEKEKSQQKANYIVSKNSLTFLFVGFQLISRKLGLIFKKLNLIMLMTKNRFSLYTHHDEFFKMDSKC